jgi:hypothetical protein
MIMTSMIQLRIQLFSLQVIINSYQNKSHLPINTVNTLLIDLIDLIDNFGIMNIIWMDVYIRDWKASSRNLKFRHMEI